jgi:hypothetical protein
MNPVLGEFLKQAHRHLKGALSPKEEPPGPWAPAAIAELDRITTIMTRYLTDSVVTVQPGADDGRPLPATVRATARIGHALRHAATILGPVAQDLPLGEADPGHHVVGELSAVAGFLAAGADLLQTHFIISPGESRKPDSGWALVITSGPVAAALASEMAGIARQLAPWAAALARDDPWSPFAPASARSALGAVSRSLQDAATAADSARFLRSAITLARAIPVNAPPPPVISHGREQILDLSSAVISTAERLRYVTRPSATRANPLPGSSVSWLRHAQAAAIVGHCSETILRTLACRAQELGYAAADLRIAADTLAPMWHTWRTATRAWDTITTGTPPGPDPVATEIGNLVLWTGRLASRNPTWTPARCTPPTHTPQHAFDHREFTAVLAAIHHATDAVTQAGRHDHQAIWGAAADLRLLTATSAPPLAFQIPYRYLSATTTQADDLLATYGAAVQASIRATAALDKLATNLDIPTVFFTAIHAAARRHPALMRTRTRKPVPLTSHRPLPQPPGQIEWKLHDLGITDHHLLARAKAADQDASDILDCATRTSRQQIAGTARLRKAADQHAPSDAVHLAAQDCPQQTPGITAAMNSAIEGSEHAATHSTGFPASWPGPPSTWSTTQRP